MNKCVQCGWPKESHPNGFCYSHSDTDSDIFYTDRKYVSPESLKGKDYYIAFNGMVVIRGDSKNLKHGLQV